MVKILTCGDVLGNWSPLLARLDELQRSKHGPFDVLLIAGKCFKDKNQYESVAPSIQLPLKTYVFNPFGFPTNSNDTNIENLVIVSKESLGITTLLESGLTVSFFIGDSLETVATEMKNINSIANAPGFRGCDVLITSEWPREMHHFLSSTELDELKSTNISIGSGSKGPVELALILKPRYHFVSGMGSYFQRSPYSNNSSGRPAPCTRLIAVDKVSESKDKAKKWLHAIAIPPITHMSPEEIAELPQGCTDCPYVEVGGSKGKRSADDAYGTAKKMKFSDSIPASTASGAFFFGDKGTAGPGGPSDANSQSASCKSLFIGGLSREMTDFELKNALPNAIVVKRPSGKAFAFVDFASHEAALKVLETSARRGLVVSGKTLTVGWAKEKPGVSSSAGGIEVLRNDEDIVYERQLVPPTSTATVLFFGGLPTTLVPHASSPGVSLTDSDKNGDVDFVKEFNDFLQIDSIIAVAKLAYKSYAYVQFQDYNDAMAIISKSINEKISMGGKALTIGWAKDDIDSMNLSTNNTNMITKQPYPTANVLFVGGIHRNVIDADVSAVFYSEKVTSVKRPEGKDYAFVEFASPYEAQHAITRCSKQEYILQGTKLVFGWAKGRAADILTESADCWFCLASPSVKVHLVVSVGSFSYLSLPRGGITDNHILIIPIQCVPSRVHLTSGAKDEMQKYLTALDSYFYEKLDGEVAIRFERAIRTKGSRDHMQIQIIPVPQKMLKQIMPIFLQKLDTTGLRFHEIQDERPVEDVVVNMDGGPYQEYFYIELPVSVSNIESNGKDGIYTVVRKRFVYVHEDTGERFPMQFGPELVAEIIQRPERAHWKNCLLSDSAESNLAENFRENFHAYDFTLK